MGHNRSQETPASTGQHTPLEADERSVLSRLLHTPLLRVEDLHISTGLSRATLYRLLARMQQHTWVEAVSIPALGVRSCSCYYLSTQGIARLAHEQGDDPVHLARQWGATEHALLRLLPRAPQRLALQEILWEVCLSAPEHLTSQGQRSAIAWHIVHDYAYPVPEGERQGSRCRVSALVFLRRRPQVAHYPDALREEAAQQQARAHEAWYALQFLQDSPLLSMSAIERWLARLMVARAHAPWFSPVVVLLASPEREALWHACARWIGEQQQPHTAFSAIVTVLTPDTTRQAEDFWLRSFRQLGTGTARRLDSVLSPVALDTLPTAMQVLFGNEEATTTPTLRPIMPEQAMPSSLQKATKQHSRATPIVRGRFANRIARARASQRLHHLPVPLAALTLTERERGLLSLLEHCPFASVEELASWLGLRPSTVARQLGELARAQWVQEAHTLLPEHPHTRASTRWVLTERSLSALAATSPLPLGPQMIVVEGSPAGHSTVLPKRAAMLRREAAWRHQRGVYAICAHLARACRMMSEAGTAHSFWWSAQLGTRRYRWQDTICLFQPDVLFEIRTGEHRLRYWLEYLAGDPSGRTIERTLLVYSRYVQSRAWRAEDALLPRLCVVLDGPAQERRFARGLTQEAPLLTPLSLLSTTMGRIHTRGAFAPIWWSLLPTRGAPEEKAPVRVSLLDASFPSREA
ncbi:hypothetical protein KSF_086870 [Reticulibacter mediterranei]|uniref:Uncharacterized protein n=1 Tax=Reticulibacter mediterranei TaxID=2778369 RepID=A0A8J3IN23_9CHLR|nr:hypothetical protein [Reticulibacter mediterranei]GHO98639.1 hypothetical protein KSF_086870 [Reticulibacter mediterranei]